MYIPSFKLISQSMLKKSPENADGRTDGRTDRRTDGRTLPRHNTSRFSNGRIKRNTPPTNIDIIIDHCGVRTQCHSLLSSKTSCPQSWRNLWAVRYVFKVIKSLWHLTGTPTALHPNSLSNFKVIILFPWTILWLLESMTHCGKMSYHLMKKVGNKGLRLETA